MGAARAAWPATNRLPGDKVDIEGRCYFFDVSRSSRRRIFPIDVFGKAS